MMCKNPYRRGAMEFGCGQCIPCRINRSRMWVGRMLLESSQHLFSCFITLTYDPDSLPFGAVVRKRDVQLFLKQLRLDLAPRKIRYFICSEYGEDDRRPHYHGLLFGVSPLEPEAIAKAWGRGHVMVGTAEHASMSYVSGYCIKQFTQEGHLLRGTRTQEFALMSRKPGLGHCIAEKVKHAYQTTEGRAALQRDGITTSVFRTGGHIYPLGTYLKNKCQQLVGVTDAQKSTHLSSLAEKAFEARSGRSAKEISVERKARLDQQAFKTRPKPRRFT